MSFVFPSPAVIGNSTNIQASKVSARNVATNTLQTSTMSTSGGGSVSSSAILLCESADQPDTLIGTGKGRLWVRDDTPNVLVFTNDADIDTDLGSGGDLDTVLAAGNDANLQSIEKVLSMTFDSGTTAANYNNILIGTSPSFGLGGGAANVLANGSESVVVGSEARGGYGDVVIGTQCNKNATYSNGNVVIGFQSGRAVAAGTLATKNILIGQNAGNTCDNDTNVAIGWYADIAPGVTYSIALGSHTDSTALAAVAIGSGTAAYDGAQATGSGSIAIGAANATYPGARAVGIGAIAIGSAAPYGSANAYANNSIAIGYANVIGDHGIGIGYDCNVGLSAANGIAIGRLARSFHSHSISIGRYAESTAANQLSINVSGTTTESLRTTFARFTAVSPTAGTLAVPNAVGFLRVNISGTDYDMALFNANST